MRFKIIDCLLLICVLFIVLCFSGCSTTYLHTDEYTFRNVDFLKDRSIDDLTVSRTKDGILTIKGKKLINNPNVEAIKETGGAVGTIAGNAAKAAVLL